MSSGNSSNQTWVPLQVFQRVYNISILMLYILRSRKKSFLKKEKKIMNSMFQ